MPKTTIFNNTYASTKTFSVAGALVKWATGNGDGSYMPLYMQTLTWSFSRNVQPIEPINVAPDGTFRQLHITGTAAGTIAIGAVMVPEVAALAAFLDKAGRGCIGEKDQITLYIKPFHKGCSDTNLEYALKGFVLSSMQQDMRTGTMAKNLQGIFSTMEISY